MGLAQSGLRVAVVGATGAIGVELVELIDERGFSCSELQLLTSTDSSSTTLATDAGQRRIIRYGGPDDLSRFDIAFLAAPQAIANAIVEARPGPILIDLGAARRLPAAAPLVAPGLTERDQVSPLAAGKVFEMPHPLAHAIALVIKALGVEGGALGAVAMLGASADGHAAVSELIAQSADLLNARLDLGEGETQAAFNASTGPGEDELAAVLSAQVKRLVGEFAPEVICRVLRIPLLHGAIVALSIASATAGWHERLRSAPGLMLADEQDAAGVVDAVGRDTIIVKLAAGSKGGVVCCFLDNARRAASNALWVAEVLAASERD